MKFIENSAKLSPIKKWGLLEIEWAILGGQSGGSHAGEDLEAEIFLVVQSVGASLKHVDLVVEALDEAERNLVLPFAVSGDSVPVPIDHVGEALVGFEALPFEAGAPVVEGAAHPALALGVP